MRKRVTLADVAAASGTSPTAVSLVLNDRPGTRLSPETAARIRKAAADLGYRPNPAARSLRIGKTRTIGFISDEVTITRFASAMIRGVLDAAEVLDHTVLISETGRREDKIARAVEEMVDRQADGLIFALMGAKEIDVPRLPADVPVVLLNASSPQHHPSVLRDEETAGYLTTKLLTDAGHRDIVLIGYAPQAIANPRVSNVVGRRFAGIHRALDEAGVTLLAQNGGEVWEPALGYECMNALLDEGFRPTAVIALNDRIAFGVYQALMERRLRIPDDISIVSFDDEELASYLRPALTTARIPYELMGRTAVQMVLDPDGPKGEVLVEMPIQVRDSVRRIAPARAPSATTHQ